MRDDLNLYSHLIRAYFTKDKNALDGLTVDEIVRACGLVDVGFGQYVYPDNPAKVVAESKASEEAKRRGLKHKGFGRYADKSGTIVAKSEKGRLVPVKKKVKPKKKKAAKIKHPSGLKKFKKTSDFRHKAEIADDIISSETFTITRGKKKEEQEFEVRAVVGADGEPINTSTKKGRKKAVKVLNERIEAARPKMIAAAGMARGRGKTIVKKWLGEVGELIALRDLLESGVEAYLLPDSVPKNDILVISYTGKQRKLTAQWLSVKTTFAGEESNKRGSNALPDFEHVLGDKTIKIGKKEVHAVEYFRDMMEFLGGLWRKYSEGHVGTKHVYSDGIKRSDLLKKPIKLPNGEKGYINHREFMRARRVSEDDVNHFVKQFEDVFNPVIIKDIQKKAVKRIQKSKGKFNLLDLTNMMREVAGNLLEKTNSTWSQGSDVMTFRFNTETGAGKNAVTVAQAETVTEYTIKVQEELGNLRRRKDGTIRGIDQVNHLFGLRFGTRALGDKKDKRGYLGRLVNTSATTPVLPIEKPISEYVKDANLVKG